jgi:hypothetical protein
MESSLESLCSDTLSRITQHLDFADCVRLSLCSKQMKTRMLNVDRQFVKKKAQYATVIFRGRKDNACIVTVNGEQHLIRFTDSLCGLLRHVCAIVIIHGNGGLAQYELGWKHLLCVRQAVFRMLENDSASEAGGRTRVSRHAHRAFGAFEFYDAPASVLPEPHHGRGRVVRSVWGKKAIAAGWDDIQAAFETDAYGIASPVPRTIEGQCAGEQPFPFIAVRYMETSLLSMFLMSPRKLVVLELDHVMFPSLSGRVCLPELRHLNLTSCGKTGICSIDAPLLSTAYLFDSSDFLSDAATHAADVLSVYGRTASTPVSWNDGARDVHARMTISTHEPLDMARVKRTLRVLISCNIPVINTSCIPHSVLEVLSLVVVLTPRQAAETLPPAPFEMRYALWSGRDDFPPRLRYFDLRIVTHCPVILRVPRRMPREMDHVCVLYNTGGAGLLVGNIQGPERVQSLVLAEHGPRFNTACTAFSGTTAHSVYLLRMNAISTPVRITSKAVWRRCTLHLDNQTALFQMKRQCRLVLDTCKCVYTNSRLVPLAEHLPQDCHVVFIGDNRQIECDVYGVEYPHVALCDVRLAAPVLSRNKIPVKALRIQRWERMDWAMKQFIEGGLVRGPDVYEPTHSFNSPHVLTRKKRFLREQDQYTSENNRFIQSINNRKPAHRSVYKLKAVRVEFNVPSLPAHRESKRGCKFSITNENAASVVINGSFPSPSDIQCVNEDVPIYYNPGNAA